MKKDIKINNARNFYHASLDWAYDMYQSQTVWLRRSLLGLFIVSLLLLVSIFTNLMLIPLKEKVPYLYAFSEATGEITKLGELEATPLSTNWVISRYLLINYIINYEGYSYDLLDHAYQQVWAQSSEAVKKEYENKVKSSNPQSPYRLYGKEKFIKVHITSISRLNDNTVDIKFEKTLHDRSLNTSHKINQEAIVKWEFKKADVTQKMLDRDPLGFKVIYYQVNQVNINNNL